MLPITAAAPHHCCPSTLLPLTVLSVPIAVAAFWPEYIESKCVQIPLQLHAIWHTMLAVCIWFSFLWFRSVGRDEVEQHAKRTYHPGHLSHSGGNYHHARHPRRTDYGGHLPHGGRKYQYAGRNCVYQ